MQWYAVWTDIFWKQSCVSMNTICEDKFWRHSNYSILSDSCECGYWYVFAKDTFWETKCIDWDIHCHETLWYNSDYNTLENACICDDWYVIRDWECQKEAYSTYWILKELKNDSAIVIFKKPNSFYESYYSIDFWLWCKDVSDFIWETIVLNLMYDERLNYGDYLVLPDTTDVNWDNQHCKITYTDEIDEEDSLYTCQELFWFHSKETYDGKCTCEDWYEFLNNKCIESEDNQIPVYYSNINSNNNQNWLELTKAIQWMYLNNLTKFSTPEEFNVNDYLTREQASKFFTQYAMWVLKQEPDFSKQIKLNDIKLADNTLQPFIVLSTALSLFQWKDWYFLPFDNLTKAQAIAVIIRSKDWYKNESKDIWYEEYYNLAKSYWILDWLSFNYSLLDQEQINRWEVAILLYRIAFK